MRQHVVATNSPDMVRVVGSSISPAYLIDILLE